MSEHEATPHPHKTGLSWKTISRKKIGGIPVVYIALVVAIVAVYIAFKMKKAPLDAEVTEEVDPAAEFDTVENPTFTAHPQGGTVISVPNDPAPEPDEPLPDVPDPAPDDTYAGYDPLPNIHPGDVPKDTGDDVTPPPPVVNPPPPPTKTATKQGTPGCWHTITGNSDNGPGELATLYYGSNKFDNVTLIKSHNTERAFTVGTKVWIPPLTDPKYYTADAGHRSAPDIAAKNGVQGGGPEVKALNPNKDFPVAVGTSVRVH